MCKLEDQKNSQLGIQQGHSFEGSENAVWKWNIVKEKKTDSQGKTQEYRASINFRLENPVAKCNSVLNKKREYPLWVKVDFSHNHSINCAEYFKYIDVSRETRHMSSQGLSPSEAHAEGRRRIKIEFPTTWPVFCADRSILPIVFWSYYWHKIVIDKTVGSKDIIKLRKWLQILMRTLLRCLMQSRVPFEWWRVLC